MPMKINVGLTKKVGEPHYSSRGGSVHFEVEVEATLVRQPQELRKRIRYLFALAEESLAQQLDTSPGDGPHNGHEDDHLPLSQRPATQRQRELIARLAEQHDAPLEELLCEVFETDRCENLSLRQASQLIEILHQHGRSPQDAQHADS